jgi:hypothetical protein
MHQVVARHIDGTIIKGSSHDVAPGKPVCHIKNEEGTHRIDFADLKALYFVKDLIGDPERDDSQEPMEDDIRRRGSRLMEIIFMDDERLVVLCNSFPPRGDRFFVLPVDLESNNSRILVNRGAVAAMNPLDA